ncbi:MAG: hypothetical protein PHP03_03150 [Candidatus Pacebacteria bacterium]|nr:hypothetical protein [Candidatus Paceibacterota bacterium]
MESEKRKDLLEVARHLLCDESVYSRQFSHRVYDCSSVRGYFPADRDDICVVKVFCKEVIKDGKHPGNFYDHYIVWSEMGRVLYKDLNLRESSSVSLKITKDNFVISVARPCLVITMRGRLDAWGIYLS